MRVYRSGTYDGVFRSNDRWPMPIAAVLQRIETGSYDRVPAPPGGDAGVFRADALPIGTWARPIARAKSSAESWL